MILTCEIDGTILLLFLPHNSSFPIDGIRFQEPEAKFTLPAGPRVSGEILLFTSIMYAKFRFLNRSWKSKR